MNIIYFFFNQIKLTSGVKKGYEFTLPPPIGKIKGCGYTPLGLNFAIKGRFFNFKNVY